MIQRERRNRSSHGWAASTGCLSIEATLDPERDSVWTGLGDAAASARQTLSPGSSRLLQLMNTT